MLFSGFHWKGQAPAAAGTAGPFPPAHPLQFPPLPPTPDPGSAAEGPSEPAIAHRVADARNSLVRLHDRDERLRLALEASGMGTWTVDIRNCRCASDERHSQLYGRDPVAEVHSVDQWLQSIHPDDVKRITAIIQRALRGQEHTLAFEHRIRWADGSMHWLLTRGRVYFDHRGHAVSITGVEQDIDDRKILEMEVLQIAEAEQHRIGLELHDDVQQQLTGLGLIAENLSKQIGAGHAEQRMARRLARGISEATRRVQALSHGLVTLDLGSIDLCVALDLLARDTATAGLRCVYGGDPDSGIRDGFVAAHLYRIAQEAVTNVLKHSGASRIKLSYTQRRGRVVMTVSDNGCGAHGCAAATPCIGGRGMRLMTYRAGLIGATLRVVPRRPRGTRLICELSLPAQPGPADTSPTATP